MTRAADSTYPVNPALEAAVIADAENDAPRLVYSDWLEEHGDLTRADFIRVQCALWDKHPADDDYPDLIERQQELRVRIQRHPLEPRLPAGVGFHDSSIPFDRDDAFVAYHRGFAYFAGQPYVGGSPPGQNHAEVFRDALPALLAETTIRGLNFHDFSRYLGTVLDPSAAALLTAISCFNTERGADGRTAAEVLASCPAAPNLQWIGLYQIDPESDVNTLAAADFHRLRRFEGPLWMRSARAMEKLFAAGWFGRLHRVRTYFDASSIAVADALGRIPELHTVECYQLHLDVVGTFAAPGAFPALGRLSAHGVPLRGSGATTLARAELPQLSVLELARCELHNDDLRVLAGSRFFERLRVLSLPSNQIGDRGMATLASSPAARTLRILRLGDNTFGKSGLAALARPGAFPNLTTLDFHSSLKRKATESEVAHFLRSLALEGLRHLNLDNWPVDDAAAQALAGNAAFANLRWLGLAYGRIGEAGLRALATSPHLRNLVYLDLSSNPCEKSAEILADPALLPSLAECWVNPADASMRTQLTEARPEVRWI
jgi:uncharacterized protein (TIGR02996 family)